MNETETFKIRAYSKKELALLYFPDSAPPSAVCHLRAWINGCKPLREQLLHDGYRKTSKSFTPRQVQTIVENLGEP